MARRMKKIRDVSAAAVFLLAIFAIPVSAGELKADYLYQLSDFTGTVPYNWVRPVVDPKTHEVYVANFSERSIRVFNDKGMAIFEFGDDISIGNLYDLAVEDDGGILLLSSRDPAISSFTITRCNFRGERVGTLVPQGIPVALTTNFHPSFICSRNGRIYIADKEAMKVLIMDAAGQYLDGIDMASILGLGEKEKRDSGLVGLSVDKDGNLLFTVPVNFQAYVLSPAGKLRSFGVKGSSPGKFNIIGGIVADNSGNIYVADTLRCVVMAFDKDFNFRTEFGYRGNSPENLVAPQELAIDEEKLYITQSRNRGVSVFRITAG